MLLSQLLDGIKTENSWSEREIRGIAFDSRKVEKIRIKRFDTPFCFAPSAASRPTGTVIPPRRRKRAPVSLWRSIIPTILPRKCWWKTLVWPFSRSVPTFSGIPKRN